MQYSMEFQEIHSWRAHRANHLSIRLCEKMQKEAQHGFGGKKPQCFHELGIRVHLCG